VGIVDQIFGPARKTVKVVAATTPKPKYKRATRAEMTERAKQRIETEKSKITVERMREERAFLAALKETDPNFYNKLMLKRLGIAEDAKEDSGHAPAWLEQIAPLMAMAASSMTKPALRSANGHAAPAYAPPTYTAPPPSAQPIGQIKSEVVAVDRAQYERLKAEGVPDHEAVARARIPTSTQEPEPTSVVPPQESVQPVITSEWMISHLAPLVPEAAGAWFVSIAREQDEINQLIQELCSRTDPQIPALFSFIRLRAPHMRAFVSWLEERPEWTYQTIAVVRRLAGG